MVLGTISEFHLGKTDARAYITEEELEEEEFIDGLLFLLDDEDDW